MLDSALPKGKVENGQLIEIMYQGVDITDLSALFGNKN